MEEKKKQSNLPVVSSQEELTETLRKSYTPDKFNLLVPPAMNFSSPYHKVALVPVWVDTTVDDKYHNGREIWSPDGGKSFTFHLTLLNKLAGTANIIWKNSQQLKREVDPDDKRTTFIEHQVEWSVQKPDGSWRHGKTVGYYNYQEDKQRFSRRPAQVESRRNFSGQMAESNAKTRAIFEALDGISRQYTKEELKKPFLVPRVVEDYRDLIGDDPQARRMYLAHVFGMSDKLSGPEQIEAPAEEKPKGEQRGDPSYIPDAEYTNGIPEPPPSEEPGIPQAPPPEIGIAADAKAKFKAMWDGLNEKDRVEGIVALMGQKNYRLEGGKLPQGKEEQIKFAYYLYNLPNPEPRREKMPWDDISM